MNIPNAPQPVIAVAQAYQALLPELHARLEVAFAGNMNLAQIVGLSRQIVAQTDPDALALVLARLISVSTEGMDQPEGDDLMVLDDGADWPLPAWGFDWGVPPVASPNPSRKSAVERFFRQASNADKGGGR